jgi:hypothetical protein
VSKSALGFSRPRNGRRYTELQRLGCTSLDEVAPDRALGEYCCTSAYLAKTSVPPQARKRRNDVRMPGAWVRRAASTLAGCPPMEERGGPAVLSAVAG